MQRTFDSNLLDLIANDPLIRPLLGGNTSKPIDMSAFVNDTDNVFMDDGQGGFAGFRMSEDAIEVHTLYPRGTDFKDIMEGAALFLEYVFTRTPITTVYTKCPNDAPGTAAMGRKLGFQLYYSGEIDPVSFMRGSVMSLTIDRWATVCSTTRDVGHNFHNLLKDDDKLDHDEFDVHDHIVGAAILMGQRGMIAKGANFYNRWAKLAGFSPVAVASAFPLIVSFGGVFVELIDEKMRIVKCP